MSLEKGEGIREIFRAAIELAPAERALFLIEACQGDEELKREVERLIAESEETTDPKDDTNLSKTDPLIGQQVGVYTLTEKIGTDGMRTVYAAERTDGLFRKKVAVKIIKQGLNSKFIFQRFLQERQILAALNHPFIPRLVDGGRMDDGSPYFVMDYIDGEPLYSFCHDRKLNINERLEIFRRILEAIEYAHQSGVIHRAMKPSNILIKPDGMPRLLEFGVAKVLNPELDPDITIDPLLTAIGFITPEYASPEQIRGEAVTKSSDIYSLGVLLYELLTGQSPYHFKSRAPHDIAYAICEQPVGPLSVVRGQLQISESEGLRTTDNGLNEIVLKALRKNPAERYQSAAELNEDITRYLDGKPVLAGSIKVNVPEPAVEGSASFSPQSIAVLPLKVLNPVQTSAGGGGEFLSVGLADAIITKFSNLQSLIVRPTSSIMRYTGMGDPCQSGRELGVGLVLDGSLRFVGTRVRASLQLLDVAQEASVWAHQFDETFTDALELEDSISAKVAEALLPHLTGAERKKIDKRGTDKPEAFEAFMRGRFHFNQFTSDGFSRAIVYFKRAVEIDPGYALAYAAMADCYVWFGIYGLTEPRQAFAAAKEAAGRALELDRELAEAYVAMGAMAVYVMDWERAEAMFQKGLEIAPNYHWGYSRRSILRVNQGRYREAVEDARRAAELNPIQPFSRQHLGWICYHTRHLDEALEQYRKLAETAPDFAVGRFMYGWALRRAGNYADSLAEIKLALSLAPKIKMIPCGLAASYAAAGEEEKAYKILRELEENADQPASGFHMAVAYAVLGEKDTAFELLQKAVTAGDAGLLWLGSEPQFDPLRDDPRYTELLRQINHPTVAKM